MVSVLIVKDINTVILRESDGPQYVNQSKNQITIDVRGRNESVADDKKGAFSDASANLFL